MMGPPDDDDPGYKVGPGKPPLKDRFQLGRSGNPKGRPKKKPKAAGAEDELSLTDLILAESKRSLTLTEDGQSVTLSAARAVLRAMLATAGKLNAHAQSRYLKQILDAEARKQKVQSEAFGYALRIKLGLEDLRDKWVGDGRAEMSMEIHPSDVEINCLTGDVKYFVTLTDEDRAARAMMLDHLTDGHAVLARNQARIVEDEDDDALLKLGRELAIIKIHFANELLPSRLRREPPPEFTVSAEMAAMYLDCDWTGAEEVRATMARKLGVSGKGR